MTQDPKAPADSSLQGVPIIAESEELNVSEREILDYIRARYSFLYIVSSEEKRVEESLRAGGQALL